MFTAKRTIILGICVLAASALLISSACDAVRSLAPGGAGTLQGLSKGRLEAMRVLNGVNAIRVNILQKDPNNALQSRCFPFGDGGANVAWTSTIGGQIAGLNPFVQSQSPSEYNLLRTVGETDYILSIRAVVPQPSDDSDHFTSLEFSFRAVNPNVTGHAAGTDYAVADHARFPSNDDTFGNRSLFSLSGGDVAILVQGIQFLPVVSTTKSTMNTLGPTGWLFFLRDNALRSGRFFAVSGGLTGGPAAFEDTPSLTDNGLFKSVQVNGDMFDFISKDAVAKDAGDLHQVCVGGNPADINPDLPDPPFTAPNNYPLAQYTFLDLSGRNNLNAAAPSQGGFLFIIRQEAFKSGIGAKKVVIDPSVGAGPPPAPAFPTSTNQLSVPHSGYNELNTPGLTGVGATDHSGDPNDDAHRGVHELGLTVFFVHTL